jgi:hypothetical protein
MIESHNIDSTQPKQDAQREQDMFIGLILGLALAAFLVLVLVWFGLAWISVHDEWIEA